MSSTKSQALHVEVAVHGLCPVPLSALRAQWMQLLEGESHTSIPLSHDQLNLDLTYLPPALQQSSRQVTVSQDGSEDWNLTHLWPPLFNVRLHVFYLSEEEVSTEELEPEGGDDEWTAGCDSLPLPHVSLDGLWENLIFEANIKQSLLDYAQTALLFSDRSVSSHVVHWNRILLLHGVPGTGKTSLCRCLAHKLAIRLDHRFPRSTLLDVRAHSLFSKWFSTSGKLVSTLFQMVRDMVQDDPSTLVFVLVDEVESLASSRSNAGGGDPSDAMRAVNSLLTSLDRLRTFPNVLVLATTNLTHSVDAAFVDRVDLKVHIGLPILKARYHILKSCLEELQRVGIVVESGVDENHASPRLPSFDEQQKNDGYSTRTAKLMLECAQQAEGLSGRSLRRLPLQAHAQFLHGAALVNTDGFLKALLLAIQSEQTSRVQMVESTKLFQGQDTL